MGLEASRTSHVGEWGFSAEGLEAASIRKVVWQAEQQSSVLTSLDESG